MIEKKESEKLADQIGRMADALEQISGNPFNKKLLRLYIHDKTGLGKQKIDLMLEAIEEFVNEMNGEE